MAIKILYCLYCLLQLLVVLTAGLNFKNEIGTLKKEPSFVDSSNRRSLIPELPKEVYSAKNLQEFEVIQSKLNGIDDRDTNRLRCLYSLKDQLRDIMVPYIQGKNALLLDQVFHWNIGDSFIQTAEHIFLREMGSPNRIPCTAVTYFLPCNKTQIAEEIKNDARDPILLIRGGGNYGDLYYVHRKFVNEYVSSFKNVPILLLPQSVYYQNTSHARRDAQIRNHSNFVLLARDKVSLNFMKTFFPNQDSYLSPDFAQYIGPVDRSQCKQTVDILFLARISKDVEKVAELGNVYEVSSQLQKRNLTSQVMDWFDYPRILTRRKWKPPTNLMEFPEFRTKVGIWMLCQGRVIVTDRLHATIMSTLLGLPYVYLDNTYKKIQNYRESWLSPNPDCSDENLRARKASTWQTAAEMAVELYQNEYSS